MSSIPIGLHKVYSYPTQSDSEIFFKFLSEQRNFRKKEQRKTINVFIPVTSLYLSLLFIRLMYVCLWTTIADGEVVCV